MSRRAVQLCCAPLRAVAECTFRENEPTEERERNVACEADVAGAAEARASR
eukprot:gene33066-10639_t